MNQEETTSHCLNCGYELKDSFCSHCGQSATISKITFKETIQGFLSSSFALEGPLMHTIVQLLKNPGLQFREFISGKRKPYYKPVAFFIVCTAAYILIRALIGYDPLEGQVPQDSTSMHPSQKMSMDAARFMVDNVNNIMFTLVLSIGLMLKLFFRKQHNLAEYTTVGFYIAGMYIIFGIPYMLLQHYLDFRFNQIQLLILFSYMLYCLITFFQSTKPLKIFKYILASGLSILFYMIFGFGLSMLIVSFQS